MINNSSAAIATNLSEILVQQGLTLVPKNNTLLKELVLAISNNKLIDSQNYTSKDYIEHDIVFCSSGKSTTTDGKKTYIQSSHDIYMDSYIEDLIKLVTSYVSYTRNVVNKQVNMLQEKIQNSLNNYKFKEPEEFFNLKFFKLNDIFNSYIISTEISNYVTNNDSTNKHFFQSLNLNKVKSEDFDINKYLLTGDSEQDVHIQSWLSAIDINTIKHYICDNVLHYNFSVTQTLDYALVNYLFYRNLTLKTDIDTGNTELTLRNYSSSNRDYFGNMLYLCLEMYRKDIRNGKILGSESELNYSYLRDDVLNVVVYEENFAKLAEAGLNIDVIFGYISSGSNQSDVKIEELINISSYYINKWNNIRSLYLIKLNDDRLDIFKHILSIEFNNLKTLDDEEKEFLQTNTNYQNDTNKLANEYINNLHISDIEDLHKICLELIAKIRFRFTSSYYILKEMNEILKMDDKITTMEAALYASLNYLVDYMIEQFDVVKQ